MLERAREQLVSTPRTLPNGAPACGNTMGKGESCAAEVTEREHADRMAQVVVAASSTVFARVRVEQAAQSFAAITRSSR